MLAFRFLAKLVKLLASLLIIIAVTFTLDFGASQFCKSNCDFWVDLQNLRRYRAQHRVHSHGLATKAEFFDHYAGRTYPVFTNSLGFKDASSRDVPLAAEGHRVLFMGDSFVEGVGLTWEESMTGRVAEVLKGRGIGVLNGGVAGYAPSIYRRKIEYLLDDVGLEVDEVVVEIDVSDPFDEARHFTTAEDGSIRFRSDTKEGLAFHFDNWRNFRRWIRENSAIVRLGYAVRDHFRHKKRKRAHAERLLAAGFDRPKPAVVRENMWSFQHGAFTWDREQYDRYGREGLAKAKANMDALAAFLKKKGVPLTVAIHPWPDQLLYGQDVVSARDFWVQWGRDRGVPVIDLFDDFDALLAESGLSKLEFLDKYFIRFDAHWNAEGSRRVAEWILRDWRPSQDKARGH